MDRLRRAYNWIYIRLRPVRRKLRDPEQRALILKWCVVGMMAYLFLYTAFYIIIRNNYLFGLAEESNGLLEQYTLDLKSCWHDQEHQSEATKLPMKVSFHSVEALQALKTHPKEDTQGSRRVLVLPDERHKHSGEHLDTLLDAGMCIATHNTIAANTKNKQSYLRSFSTPDSSSTDTTHAMHTIHTTTTTNTSTNTNTAMIDTTHYTTRCLPSFIIAGAMKCGTGELMKWLQLHPSLTVGSNNDKRELHYFTSVSNSGDVSGGTSTYHNHTHRLLQATHSTYTNTTHTTHRMLQSTHNTTHITHISSKPSLLAEYSQFFPAFSSSDLEGLITFEKSPDYIRDPTALKLIRAHMPGMKIIILLRNPIVRALSEFSHHCRHGRYIRLISDVAVDGIHYSSGSIVRTDMHTSSSASSGSDNGGSGVPRFPKGCYEVLSYPCSAADAEAHFSGSAGYTSYISSVSGSGTSDASSNNTATTTLTEHTTNNTSTIPTTHHNSRAHHVPEIEHGLYDHQLAALYEIFPAEQVLVLLQEDMYRHTFRTLRQVESFLKIGCFDYQAYSIIPTSSVMTKPLLDAQDNGDDAFTDDHYTDTPTSTSNTKTKNQKQSTDATIKSKKSKKSKKHHAKPPRRAPQTFNEKMKHYKAELEQYLSSWKGSSMSTGSSLYDTTSSVFKEYLHSVYRSSNNKLSMLMNDRYNNQAYCKEHLIEMGWDLGV